MSEEGETRKKQDIFTKVKNPTRMTKSKFLLLLPRIRSKARELGYAIGVHGSLTRDYDLIACPWTKDAVDSDKIAEAIFTVVKATRWRLWWDEGKQKPYDRKVYSFDWGYTNKNYNYIDLSVISKGT